MEFLGARKGRTVENVSEVQHTQSDEKARSEPRYRKSGPRDDEYFGPALKEPGGQTKASTKRVY